MNAKLFLLLIWGVFSALAQLPVGVNARYIDIGPAGQSVTMAIDEAGDNFAVSTVTEPSGRPQIRVTKTDPLGNVLAAFDFGGSGRDTPRGAATDPSGNVIVVGTTSSADFPVTSALVASISGGAAFVTKLNAQLTAIIASTTLGGSQYGPGVFSAAGTEGDAVAVDTSGNIYVAGSTYATNFPVTQGAFQTTPPGNDAFGSALDGFLVKLSSGLNQILFGTYFGGNQTTCVGGSACIGAFGSTQITSLALDSTGAPVTAGFTTASDLPSTPGAYATQCGCTYQNSAGFIAKFSSSGSSLVWSTFLNNEAALSGPLTSNITIKAIAIDSLGEIVVGGSAPNGFTVTQGAIQSAYPVPASASNAWPYAGFVAKLNGTGADLLFSTYFGSASLSGGVQSLAAAPDDSIWLTGSSLPDALPGTVPIPALGSVYVANLSASGSAAPTVFTASAGSAGQAAVVSGTGAFSILGQQGALLLESSPNGPSVVGVANAAGQSVSGRIAPAELISLYGYNLGPSPPLGAQVANGYEVLFNGLPSPLLYAGSSQITCVVPSELYGQNTATVQIKTPQGTFLGPTLFLYPSQPDVFLGASGFAAALNQDGSINSAGNPAAPGTIIVIWATGAGLYNGNAYPTDGTIVTASSLGYPALPVSILSTPSGPSSRTDSLDVQYAGDAPDDVFGVLQVNFQLPDSFVAGTTATQIQLQVGSATSAPVSIYVHP